MGVPQNLLSTLGIFSSGSGIVSDLTAGVSGVLSIIEYLSQFANG